MHLIALCWDVERPGWLDPAVHRLARAVASRGATCEVVTLGAGLASTTAVGGVEVTWVAEAPPVLPEGEDYDLARVLATATRASASAEGRCQRTAPDVVLAFGWQTAWTATTLRASRGTPLVAVMESTAPARADGPLDDRGRLVAQVEWWLTYEARRVVAPTDAVARALRRAYRLPAAKVDTVGRGVDLPDGSGDVGEGDEVVVLGPAVVVERVRSALPPVRVTSDRGAVAAAAVVVVLDPEPEPLLAAMAAGRAVVVADDGPLRGLVHARRSGVRVDRDPEAVADAVATLLRDPRRRARMGEHARDRVARRHGWDAVAAAYLDVARRAVDEEDALGTTPVSDRPLRPILLRSPLLGWVGDHRPSGSNGPHADEGHG